MSVPRVGARWAVTAAPILALTPLVFALGRPVMIDDPLFLKSAAQILQDPLRPLDVTTYWWGSPAPLWFVLKNPPGVAYWLAGVLALGGGSEVAFHLAMLPFAVASVLAGVRLARRFAGDSPWITAAWVASPAFVVSASTLMADVPSLAFTLWGTALYVDGVDRDRRGWRLAGALLAGIAVVIKYPALIGVLVLVAYPLLRPPPAARGRPLVDLWPAAVPLALWGVLNLWTHGRLHLVDSLFWLAGDTVPTPWRPAHKVIATVTFLPAAAIFPVLFAPLALRSRSGILLVASCLAVGVAVGVGAPALWPGASGWTAVAVGVIAVAGSVVAIAVGREALTPSDGDGDTRFLAIWAGVAILFVAFGAWTVAVRFLLPALPPLAWLVARAIGSRPGRETPAVGRSFIPTTAVAFALAVVVLRADAVAAEFHRDVVARVAVEAGRQGRRVHFLGAWSMLYYAERAGMRWLDAAREPPRPGDWLVGAHFVSNSRIPGELAGRLRQVAEFSSPVPPLGIQTMNPLLGAGFYSSLFGPLPFVVSREPATGAVLYRIE